MHALYNKSDLWVEETRVKHLPVPFSIWMQKFLNMQLHGLYTMLNLHKTNNTVKLSKNKTSHPWHLNIELYQYLIILVEKPLITRSKKSLIMQSIRIIDLGILRNEPAAKKALLKPRTLIRRNHVTQKLNEKQRKIPKSLTPIITFVN